MKPQSAWGSLKNPVKFKIPTAENLVPIRLDIEIDGQRFRDAFSWNPNDPDSEVVVFARRTVKDLKLPPGFITQIAQSIQLDLRVNHTVIKDHYFWDLNNFESDPEEFARTFCKDMEIEDPEVGPAIAISIREQLYEIAIQSVASARESRANKKRRVTEHISASKTGVPALDLVKLFGIRSSVVRKRKDWDVYEPIVDLLSNEEVDALEAREEKVVR
ncbi:chromatin structure-remodeling complex protein BSH isoform X2 [Nicotiana tomentosiformis]|uniref:chromatin structure-remodeling complex protein BSH isoform X2 n=1 Tax=Nicotiana tomentosiformis TaxID=4098 RepID=UPI00388C500D